jgi:hypothetical protein
MEKPAFLIAVSKAGNGGTSAPPSPRRQAPAV